MDWWYVIDYSYLKIHLMTVNDSKLIMLNFAHDVLKCMHKYLRYI